MYYLLILVLLFLAELFYFKVADRCNIIDKPNERSSHTKVTLRGGGIIFYFGALAYFLTSDFEYPWFLLALTLVTFISFVDDIKSTGQMTRLLFHFSAMAMMFYQWGLFSLSWWWIVIALIVCTGIINAYNFMDGINGITGGYSLVILAALAYVNNEVVTFVEATIIHRLMLHENIGLPHRKHLYQIMANELKIPHVIVSLAYMTIQTLIIVGYIYCQRYGYIFLIGCILLLSAIYVLFMKKYFSRHVS